jgi:ribosomal protein S27AE
VQLDSLKLQLDEGIELQTKEKKEPRCRSCNSIIRWKRLGGKWVAFEKNGRERHNCRSVTRKTPTALIEEIRKLREKATKESPVVKQLLERYERVKENLELARRQFLDNPKWAPENITDEMVPELARRCEKISKWLDEHGMLVRNLVKMKVDREEWHCKRCGAVITAALVGRDSCWRCTDDPKSKRFHDLFEHYGWVAIKCPTLDGEVVVIVRDDTVQVPEHYGKSVRYMPDEIRSLMASPGGLRMIHEVKRTLGGKVLPKD